MSEEFSTFRVAANAAKKVTPFVGTVLALDPGETTGWALFSALETKASLISCGQIKTWEIGIAVQNLSSLLDQTEPDLVIRESYNIYQWKTDDHTWSSVPTLQIIGCLETLCFQRSILVRGQTAQVAKNFCSDQLLKAWGMYKEGQRHARDAIRHGSYFLACGQLNSS